MPKNKLNYVTYSLMIIESNIFQEMFLGYAVSWLFPELLETGILNHFWDQSPI